MRRPALSRSRAPRHASISASKVARTRDFSAGVVDRRRRARRCAGAWKIVRPTAKPRHVRARRGVAEALAPARRRRRSSPSSSDAAAVRIALGDQRVDRLPLRGAASARASTTRDRCRGCRGASSRGRPSSSARGSALRRNDLEQQLVPARLHRVVQRARSAPRSRGGCRSASSGMELHEALDDVLDRPGDRASCRSSGRGRTRTGLRARQLDRPADPPAAAGRRVERVLAVAVVAQDADAARRARARASVSRDRLDAAAA